VSDIRTWALMEPVGRADHPKTSCNTGVVHLGQHRHHPQLVGVPGGGSVKIPQGKTRRTHLGNGARAKRRAGSSRKVATTDGPAPVDLPAPPRIQRGFHSVFRDHRPARGTAREGGCHRAFRAGARGRWSAVRSWHSYGDLDTPEIHGYKPPGTFRESGVTTESAIRMCRPCRRHTDRKWSPPLPVRNRRRLRGTEPALPSENSCEAARKPAGKPAPGTGVALWRVGRSTWRKFGRFLALWRIGG